MVILSGRLPLEEDSPCCSNTDGILALVRDCLIMIFKWLWWGTLPALLRQLKPCYYYINFHCMYQSGMHYIECAIIYIALLHQSVIIIHGFTLCESLPNDWPADEGRYPNCLLLPPGKDSGPCLLAGENVRACHEASHLAHKGSGYRYGNQNPPNISNGTW